MRTYFVTLIFALLALTAGQAWGEYAARPTLASVMEMFMPPENSREATLPWNVEAGNPAITWYEGTFNPENGRRLKQGAILIGNDGAQRWGTPGYEKPALWLIILEGGRDGVEFVTLFPSDGRLVRHPSNGRSVFEEAVAQNRRMKFWAVSSTTSLHNGYETKISQYQLTCSGKRSVTVEHAISATPEGNADELALIINANNLRAGATEPLIDPEDEPGMPGNRADSAPPSHYPRDNAAPGRANMNKNPTSWDSEAKLNERLEKSRKMARDLMQ